MPKALVFLLGAMFLALAQTSWGQKGWNWRVYKLADGLPEPACISVTLGSQGKVLAKHFSQPFITELDGYTNHAFPSPETSSPRIYESPAGQLWTANPRGLLEFKDGLWLPHPVLEIEAEFRAGASVPLLPIRQGLVIFLLPERLLEFSSENPDRPRTRVLRRAAETGLQRFSSMAPARDGGLWIAGARGLIKIPGPVRNLKPENLWREFLAPEALAAGNFQEPHPDENDGVFLTAESAQKDQRLIVHFDGTNWTARASGTEKLRLGWRGPDGTSWAATIDTLLQWDGASAAFVESEEVSAHTYYDVAVEPNGTFWLATSDGLFRYAPLLWQSPRSIRKAGSLVHCIVTDAEERLWYVSGSGLHELQNDRHVEHSFPPDAVRRLQGTTAMFPLRDGSLLLASGDELFRFHPATGRFAPLSVKGRANLKVLGTLSDGSLCVQSRDPEAPDSAFSLEAYNGVRFEALPLPAPEPALGTNFSAFFAAQNGDYWISGENGVAWFRDQKWRTFTSSDNSTPAQARCFAQMADGKIWCATQDRVWQFDGKNWSESRRGFDRINAMVRTRDGSLWVASNGGLHRLVQGTWIDLGLEEGLPSLAVRDLCEDSHGHLWAGTSRGLSSYHPEADEDAPVIRSIQGPRETDKSIPEGSAITVSFRGQDKWKYCERLLYSYCLDGREWSDFTENTSAMLLDCSGGKHYFLVRAADRNANIGPASRFEFLVALPWYKETRLVFIAFAGLAVALFFAGLAFNRHLQLVRSYAEVEQKVAERTRELELANRELLHSQKMTALGTLATGIAHDFNNILSIVKGSAQLIEENLDRPDKIRTRVDRIKTVVEQGSGIVKAMLGFSRDSSQQPALCELNTVVEDTIKLLGDRFLREVQVLFNPAPDLPPVPASKDFIQQILLNFIFNAAEAMAKRRQIILATRNVTRLPANPVLMPGQAPAYVAVSVQDFGCGIAPANLSRIFEPFFTTKAFSARRGTGLGLSMVYELAKKTEAGLAVESMVGQGSTFTLILPVCPLPPAAGPAGQQTTQTTHAASLP